MSATSSNSPTTSSTTVPPRQQQVQEIAPRVFLLYDPPPHIPCRGDLVFVHGLNSNEFRCWTNKGQVLWPQQFLPMDFASLRVISIGYSHDLWGWGGHHHGSSSSSDSSSSSADTASTSGSSSRTRGEMSVEECAANVFERLVDPRVRVGCRPTVFITHSMGGLVVKQMIVQQYLSLEGQAHRFLDRVEGIVFYATPHFGSPIASVLSGLEYFVGNAVKLSGVVTALGDHNAEQLTALNRQFLTVVEKKGMRMLSFAEGKKLNGLLVVVDAVSANPAPQSPQHPFHVIMEDHQRLNTPESRSEMSYTLLRSFLGEVLIDDPHQAQQQQPALVDSSDAVKDLPKHHAALLSRRSRAMATAELQHLDRVADARRRVLFGLVEPTEVAAVVEVLAELLPFATHSDTHRDERVWYPLSLLLFWYEAFVRVMERMQLLRKERAVVAHIKSNAASFDDIGGSATSPLGAHEGGGHHHRRSTLISSHVGFSPRELQSLEGILNGVRALEGDWRSFHRATQQQQQHRDGDGFGSHDDESHDLSDTFFNGFMEACRFCGVDSMIDACCVRPLGSRASPHRDSGAEKHKDVSTAASCSRSMLADHSFLNGWFALLVTRDLPKAREMFEAAVDHNTSGDGATSNQQDSGNTEREVIRQVARNWVSMCAAADSYTTVYQQRLGSAKDTISTCLERASEFETRLRGMRRFAEQEDVESKGSSVTTASAPTSTSTPSIKVRKTLLGRAVTPLTATREFLRRPLRISSAIRKGGAYGDERLSPLDRLLQDCTAYDRAVRARCELVLRRSHNKDDSPLSLTVDHQRLSNDRLWMDAQPKLRSEVLAARCRLQAEEAQARDDATMHHATTTTSTSSGSPSTAISHHVERVNAALRHDPTNTTALMQRAKLLHDRRRYAAAADLYHEVLKDSSGTRVNVVHTAMVGLGWTHLQRISSGVAPTSTVFDLLSAAVAPAALVSALQDVPVNDFAEEKQDEMIAEVDGQRALSRTRRAMEGDGDSILSTPLAGTAHLQRATALFREVLSVDPCQPWALCGLGRALTLIPGSHFQQGRTSSSLRVSSSASLDEAVSTFAVARGRSVAARQHFLAAWKLSEGRCHWAANWLGDCCLAESRKGHEKALEYYKMCMDCNDNNSWAMTSTALLKRRAYLARWGVESERTTSDSSRPTIDQNTSTDDEQRKAEADIIALLRHAVAVDPTNTWALWGLSSMLPAGEAGSWSALMRAAVRRGY